MSDVICDKCGKTMIIKDGKFGEFLACPGYPKCKNIKKIEGREDKAPREIVLAPCPECGKPLKEIKTFKSLFYGCTGYPDCTFTSSYPVVEGKCSKCGAYMIEKKTKTGDMIVCSNKDCK